MFLLLLTLLGGNQNWKDNPVIISGTLTLINFCKGCSSATYVLVSDLDKKGKRTQIIEFIVKISLNIGKELSITFT